MSLLWQLVWGYLAYKKYPLKIEREIMNSQSFEHCINLWVASMNINSAKLLPLTSVSIQEQVIPTPYDYTPVSIIYLDQMKLFYFVSKHSILI